MLEPSHSASKSLTATRETDSLGAPGNDHFARFYLDDEALVESLAQYVTSGLRGGSAAVVIATEPHLAALPDLSRKRERDRVAIRHTPYFQRIERGAFLGFRRGPDTWSPRFRTHDGKQAHKFLGGPLAFDETKPSGGCLVRAATLRNHAQRTHAREVSVMSNQRIRIDCERASRLNCIG